VKGTLFVLAQFLLLSLSAQICPYPEESYYKYVISTLAHDSMEGRLPGTVHEKKAAGFIENEFRKTKCVPIKKKQYVFPFDYKNPDSTVVHSAGNVLAKIETKSNKCIVISAHYDHIGWGQHHSNDPFAKKIHNGADDNASGVAMLLSLAGWYSSHRDSLNFDIVFAAFSAEEDGLFGAKEFLKSGIIDTSTIICNINLDMVGHLDKTRPILMAESALLFNQWDSILPQNTEFKFIVERSGTLFKDGADHNVFLDVHIPGILFSTGLTEHYHRPSDDESTINYEGMIDIHKYLVSVVRNMQKLKSYSEWQKL
jgi:Zn-dependent M28 family amino/carboxypeptidase